MAIDPRVLCDGSCESEKCDYFWYILESYWRSKFKDCSKHAWLGFRVIEKHCLTVFSDELRIETCGSNTQKLTAFCERNVNLGIYVRVSNKEFFEAYKQLKGKS